VNLTSQPYVLLPGLATVPDQPDYRKHAVPELHLDGNDVNQDPAHEIAGLEYLFANKKDFGGDDNARQKLGSVLI
jgi:hypothetical protein